MTSQASVIQLSELDLTRDLSKAQVEFDTENLVFYMEIKSIPDWIAEREKYWNYYRSSKLRIRESESKGEFTRQKSGGSAIWVSSSQKVSSSHEVSSSQKNSSSQNVSSSHKDPSSVPISSSSSSENSSDQPNQPKKCLAKFTINFPTGYFHNEDGSINCKDFGNQAAKIIWKWRHNHEIHTPKAVNASPLTKRVKQVLKELVEQGYTWDQLRAKIYQDGHFHTDEQIQSELSKINYGHFQYRSKAFQDMRAQKHKSVSSSLPLWADEIVEKGGLAEFTYVFPSLEVKSPPERFKTPKGHDVWSFLFMNGWQKEVLKANESFFFITSTHDMCRGIEQEEKASLFTLVVRNQATRKAVPVAFMLTNMGSATVIANFLSRVRNFSGFNPKHVTFDYGPVEEAALSHVWPLNLSMIFCRWNIVKAWAAHFQIYQKTSNSKERSEYEREEATSEFQHVLESSSIEETQQKFQAFSKKYENSPDLLEYVEEQWVKSLKLFISGTSVDFSHSETTDIHIRLFLAYLKTQTLRRSGKCRPDTLICILFDHVAPSFEPQESRTVHGPVDKELDKAESRAKRKAYKIPAERMGEMVSRIGPAHFTVASFTKSCKTYAVQLSSDLTASPSCKCTYFAHHKSRCMHIFLGLRYMSYVDEEAQQSEKELRDTDKRTSLAHDSVLNTISQNVPIFVDQDESLEVSETPVSRSGNTASENSGSVPTSLCSFGKSSRCETSQYENSQYETSQFKTSQSDTSQSETSQYENTRFQTSRYETSRFEKSRYADSEDSMSHQTTSYFEQGNEDYEESSNVTIYSEGDATKSGDCSILQPDDPTSASSIAPALPLGYNFRKILDGSYFSQNRSEELRIYSMQQPMEERADERAEGQTQSNYKAVNGSNTRRYLSAEIHCDANSIQTSPFQQCLVEMNDQDSPEMNDQDLAEGSERDSTQDPIHNSVQELDKINPQGPSCRKCIRELESAKRLHIKRRKLHDSFMRELDDIFDNSPDGLSPAQVDLCERFIERIKSIKKRSSSKAERLSRFKTQESLPCCRNREMSRL